MEWQIEITAEFRDWWEELTQQEQNAVARVVNLLRDQGPSLPRPYSDILTGSKHSNMKELRAQYRGDPYRVLYTFDPRRVAILLIGGNKKGDDRFYDTLIPWADRIYDEYLELLREEGLL